MFLLLNETDVKELVSLSANLDGEKIRHAISESQNIDIRPLLQTEEFYDEIIFQASGNTLSVANKYLLDNHLYKLHALYVKKRLVYLLSYQFENVGVVNKTSESSIPLQNSDIKTMLEFIRGDILVLQKAMLDYICEHSNDYPLFTTGDNDYGKTAFKVKKLYRR